MMSEPNPNPHEHEWCPMCGACLHCNETTKPEKFKIYEGDYLKKMIDSIDENTTMGRLGEIVSFAYGRLYGGYYGGIYDRDKKVSDFWSIEELKKSLHKYDGLMKEYAETVKRKMGAILEECKEDEKYISSHCRFGNHSVCCRINPDGYYDVVCGCDCHKEKESEE